MAAIRKSAILNSAIMDSANLHKKKNLTHSFWLNLMMAAILNSAVLNLAILYSAILIFSFKLTHTFQDWLPPFAQKTFTHSFWLNLMMAAILNSAILIFSFKLTHTFQDWFPPFSQNILLIHSDSTWWWQPSWLHHVGFRHCHLGFRHLVIFSQIDTKTLSLHSDSDSN